MAFVRSISPTYFAPASINTLSEDGALVVNKFDCQFKRLKRSALSALRHEAEKLGSVAMAVIRDRVETITAAALAAARAQADDAPPAPPTERDGLEDMVSRKIVIQVITGWRGVQAADGTDLPFSVEALDQVEEECPGFINACAAAFWTSCDPKEAAHLAAKN